MRKPSREFVRVEDDAAKTKKKRKTGKAASGGEEEVGDDEEMEEIEGGLVCSSCGRYRSLPQQVLAAVRKDKKSFHCGFIKNVTCQASKCDANACIEADTVNKKGKFVAAATKEGHTKVCCMWVQCEEEGCELWGKMPAEDYSKAQNEMLHGKSPFVFTCARTAVYSMTAMKCKKDCK